jgi:hypothetical protein
LHPLVAGGFSALLHLRGGDVTHDHVLADFVNH